MTAVARLDHRAAVRRKRLNRARVARCTARHEAGLAVAAVEYSGEILNMLVRLGWLPDDAAINRASIGKAISAMLAASAKNF
jgi:hypothetical protein